MTKSARAAQAWSRLHPKHQRDPMQWIGLSVAQLPSSCLKACKALCVPRPSRSIADAVRSDGSVYAAATWRIRKGLPQRGVAARLYKS